MFIYSHYGISVFLELSDTKKVEVNGKNSAKNFLEVGASVPSITRAELTDDEVEFLKEKYKDTDLFKKGLIYFSKDINDAKSEARNMSRVEVPLAPHPENKKRRVAKSDSKNNGLGDVVESQFLDEAEINNLSNL